MWRSGLVNDDTPCPADALPLMPAMWRWLPAEVQERVRAANEDLKQNARQTYRIDAEGRRIPEIDLHSTFNHRLLLRFKESQEEAARKFAELLRVGRLVAWARAGSPVAPLRAIPADAWATLQLIHVSEGRASGPGVELFGIHVAPPPKPAEAPRDVPLRERKDAAQHATPAASTSAAEKRLQAWLVAKMRAAPDAPQSKQAVRAEADAAGLAVSTRGFLRAYANAVDVSGATAWSKPGRRPAN